MEKTMETRMRPRDPADLLLAPVALQVDAKVQELSAMNREQLAYHLALEVDRDPRTEQQRGKDIVDAAVKLIDMSGWEANWDPRGVRLSHGRHSIVIGVGADVAEYVRSG
jgi:hypothetical protein